MTLAPPEPQPTPAVGTLPPWDTVAAPPDSPVRARLAEAIFRHAVKRLPVRIALAGGERLGAGGNDAPLMRIVDPTAFFHRLGVDAKIGFGESYMASEWDSPDLAGLLTPFAERLASLVPKPLQLLRRWVDAPKPNSERNTTQAARSHIQHHYDLSNEVFATFLDETMTYSSALFQAGEADLASAQRTKVDAVLDLADVGTGTRLLEIGTGWGELAIRAAERGAHVTTLTLSAEQVRLANERVQAAGLSDRVDIRLGDYREIEGQFDAVVSVEMIEAVGRDYWTSYFAAVERLLVPGGRAAIQAITMPHDRMLASRDSYTWIHKYIFPGGQLPSTRAMEHHAAHAGLQQTGMHAFGTSYAETLRQWRSGFLDQWEEVAALGFSDRFRRMWEFYLAYSEAGFRSGYLDVCQVRLDKAAASVDPHGKDV